MDRKQLPVSPGTFLKILYDRRIKAYTTDKLPSLMSLSEYPPMNFNDPTDMQTAEQGSALPNFLPSSTATRQFAEDHANARQVSIHSPREPTSSQADDQADFERFADQLYATLVGRPEGYNSVEHLLTDFKQWSGMDGEVKARSFGYNCFLDFVRSSAMLDRVVIVEDSALGVVYKPRPCAEIAHIQQAQAISAEYVMRKRLRNEVNREVGSVKSENNRLRLALQVEKGKVATLTTRINALSAEVDQKNSAIDELEKQVVCQLCMARKNNVVFNCGHVACSICTQRLAKCPMQCPGNLTQKPLYL